MAHPLLEGLQDWLLAGWLPSAADAALRAGITQIQEPESIEAMMVLAQIGFAPVDAFRSVRRAAQAL